MHQPPRWPIPVSLLAMALVVASLFAFASRGPEVTPETAAGLRLLELTVSTPAPVETVDPLAASQDVNGTDASPLDVLADASTIPPAAPPALPGAALDVLIPAAASMSDIAALQLPADGCVSIEPADQALAAPTAPRLYGCTGTSVRSVAAGRVIMLDRSSAQSLEPFSTGLAQWQWTRGLELGRFVVVDHGALDGTSSAISVYSRLGAVDETLRVGAEVEPGTVLGTLDAAADGTGPEFAWELWVDDAFTGPTYQGTTVKAAEWASALRDAVVAPVAAACAFPAGQAQLLPNAARAYRTGVHQGVDFGCGRGNDAFAYAPGRVLFAMNDFDDPSVSERNAVLANAARAGSTPHWILAMLYGRFVVIDHGMVNGVGPVVTISAHLDSIDPAISVGATVTAGQRLGEVGNTGTNGGAAGTDATVHLHWELLVDGTHLANGLRSADTNAIYQTALCGDPSQLDGC